MEFHRGKIKKKKSLCVTTELSLFLLDFYLFCHELSHIFQDNSVLDVIQWCCKCSCPLHLRKLDRYKNGGSEMLFVTGIKNSTLLCLLVIPAAQVFMQRKKKKKVKQAQTHLDTVPLQKQHHLNYKRFFLCALLSS